MKIKTYKAYSYKSSSSPGKMYTTLLLENGEITCNCPGWSRRVATDGSRNCKHCDDVKTKSYYFDIKKNFELKEKIKKKGFTVFGEVETKELVEISLFDLGIVETKTVDEEKEDTLSLIKAISGKSSSDRVEKMFGILREYGYLCFRNYYHRRQTALKALSTVIDARKEKDIPVSGCIWIDRECTKHIDSDMDRFTVSVHVVEGNRVTAVFGEISEAASHCDLEVTSDMKEIESSGLIVMQKTETVLPF